MLFDLPDDPQVFKSTLLGSLIEEAVKFFETTSSYPLPPPMRYNESGVYALYYMTKSFRPYARFAKLNRPSLAFPIYVGKANTRGGRTGGEWGDGSISGRLGMHSRRISQTTNLKAEDFRCRFVILRGYERDLVVPFEQGLIRHFQPLWNSVLHGFGSNAMGIGRPDQAPSKWDSFHPGRPYAMKLRGKPRDLAAITREVEDYFKNLGTP
jgi:hypothetical protein